MEEGGEGKMSTPSPSGLLVRWLFCIIYKVEIYMYPVDSS